jgi:hypothetical protein
VRRGNDFGVIGKPEVIVGTKIQDFCRTAVRLDGNGSLLRSGNESFLFEQALGLQRFGLSRKRLQKWCWHGGISCCFLGGKIISRIRANTDACSAIYRLLSPATDPSSGR